MKPSNPAVQSKLLALAENQVAATDIYQSTLQQLETIKNQLAQLHSGDTQALQRSKAKLLTLYHHYFETLKQLALNNKAQLNTHERT